MALLISGCSSLPSSFTTKNIMDIKIHSSSESIVKTFGNPTNVRSSICGSSTNNPWTCTTWTYGESYYGKATFTFYTKDDKLFLNDFDVDRD